MLHRTVGLTLPATDRSEVGYVLLAPFVSTESCLVNPAGEIVHRWAGSDSLTHVAYLLPNGNLLVNEMSENPRGVPLTTSGMIRERDVDGTVVWEHHDPWQHHDARRLPGGGAMYIAYTAPDADAATRFSGGVPNSETDAGMFGECIREVDEHGELVWEWSTDDLPDELRRLHRNANRWSAGHLNTVLPLADDSVLVCSKTMNMAFRIHRSTGELLWHFQDDDLGGPHDAQLLDNGNILIFANGAFASDLHHSQIWEVDPETNDVVWRFHQRDNPMQFFSPHIGGAQRLPGGNTLACEGAHGCLFEITSDGDIVWEYINPERSYHERFGYSNWLFRVRSYAAGSPELQALNL